VAARRQRPRTYTAEEKAEFFRLLHIRGNVSAVARELGYVRVTCYKWAHQAGIFTGKDVSDERQEFLRLRSEGVSRREAAEQVGVDKRTAQDWDKGIRQFYGGRVYPDGRVVKHRPAEILANVKNPRNNYGHNDNRGTLERLEPERVYRDKLSGTSTREQRPGLAALLDYARPGDAIVVVGIDRLGRNAAEVMTTIRELRDREIVLRSLREGIDTSNATGRMVAGVLASLAELELETVSDGVVTKQFVELPFRYTHRFAAEHLLERAGFVVESVQGGYHGEAFTSDSSVLLLVGRRSD
jgi:transposase-like protein